MRLIVGAGGTGGGIYPALAVLQASNQTDHQVLWVGSQGGLEADLVQRAGIEFQAIPAAGLHGVGVRSLPGNLIRLIKGIFISRRILEDFKPDVLFFTGGYVSLPIAYSGRRTPSLVFLPDIEPGLSIKVISRYASKIALSTEESKRFFKNTNKLLITGYPTRVELNSQVREDAMKTFDLERDKMTILVFGGSQGARSINRAIASILPELLSRYQIIHISGPKNWGEVNQVKSELSENLTMNYHAFPYLHSKKLGAAFAAANLIISRAGAAILGEFPLFGVPAVLIPYPHAWRYQQVNAEYLEKKGAAVILQDKDMQNSLLSTIDNLLNQPEKLEAMSHAMKLLAKPHAASIIMQALQDLAESNKNVSEGKPK